MRSRRYLSDVGEVELAPAVTPWALTCQFCSSAPAARLLVTDFPVIGRVVRLVCQPCGNVNLPRAAEVAASPASAWLFDLSPSPAPKREPRWDRLRRFVRDMGAAKDALSDAAAKSGDMLEMPRALAASEAFGQVLACMDEIEARGQ